MSRQTERLGLEKPTPQEYYDVELENRNTQKLDDFAKEVDIRLADGGMSTEERKKLSGIEAEANRYLHPSVHPASMITGLSPVATSGDYNSLQNKPTSLPADGGTADNVAWDGVTGKPDTYPASEHSHDNRYYTKTEIGDLYGMLDAIAPAEMHRTVFRGKNLGSSLTSDQKGNIQNGTFKGLWLGDYWVIEGRIWRIVDIDYWYDCGDTAFTKHHLVIMPDYALYGARMNEEDTTTGGYFGSQMYKTNLDQARATVHAAFGSAVLTHRELLVNAVENGRPSGGVWIDSRVDLPSECMLYGHNHFTPAPNGSKVPFIHTINKSQLALFQVYPRLIVNRSNLWLRDVVSELEFALVNINGHPHYFHASNSFGVRPVFAIG